MNIELFDYQKTVVDKCINYFETTDNPKPFNIFFKMGLGKTIMAIEIANRLRPQSILIVCPKSLISMWQYNIARYFQPRYALLDKLSAFALGVIGTYIYITNYEEFLHYKNVVHPDLCIFDEVHRIKNSLSKTHKQIVKCIRANKVLALTGTPITNNLMDLFGVLTCTGEQTFYGMTRSRFQYKYILHGGLFSKNELISVIKPYTVMGDLEEFVDMPGYEDVVIPIESNSILIEHYKLATDPYKLALARIVACQQLTSGITKDGITSNLKLNVLKDLINDITETEKVVIFTKFDAEFDYLMELFKDKCVGINGKIKDREQAVIDFQTLPHIKIFIGNLQVAGLGLTLTAATKCIIYSGTHDWGLIEQARARIYRIGQKRFCTYYHLLCKDTIDELIYKNNINKTDLIIDFKKTFGGN